VKVAAKVKIAMQCFANFEGGGKCLPPGCALEYIYRCSWSSERFFKEALMDFSKRFSKGGQKCRNLFLPIRN